MSKRTPWYPASIKPVRDGWYEWQCGSVTGDEMARAEWSGGYWYRATVARYWPTSACPSCRWRGLTRPAEE